MRRFIFSLLCTVTIPFAIADDIKKSDIDSIELPNLIITATKSGEVNQSEVPLAITVYTSDQLQEDNSNTLEDLVLETPGLSLGRNGAATRLYIRGIGTNLDFIGADPSITVHTDGIYQSRSSTALNTFLDISRIEVLRGPQGTLYGRNSTGGTINIISTLPSDSFEAFVAGEIGNYNQQRYTAKITGPITKSTLNGSFAITQSSHDPYVDNTSTSGIDGLVDDDELGAKASLHYLPTRDTEVLLRFDYDNQDKATGAYKATGKNIFGGDAPLAGSINQPNDAHEINISYAEPFLKQTSQGASGELNVQLSENLTLTSLTGYRELELKTIEDTDGSELDILVTEFGEQQDQISEELRLNYQSQRVDVVTGLYYFSENHDSQSLIHVNSVGLENSFIASNKVSAFALFSQASWHINSQLNTTLGLSYSYEVKEFSNDNVLTPNNDTTPISSFNVDEKSNWSAWSPKIGFDYTFDNKTGFDHLMTYGSISKGFKSGGFNLTSADAEFDQESVIAYEVGAKSSMLNNSLDTNISLFYYDYSDLQVSSFTQPGVLFISNAADAKVQGVEVENTWLAHTDWILSLNYGWLDAIYEKYDAPQGDVSGNTLNSSPKHSASFSSQYFQEINIGSLSYKLRYVWQDKVFFTANNEEVSSQMPTVYGMRIFLIKTIAKHGYCSFT